MLGIGWSPGQPITRGWKQLRYMGTIHETIVYATLEPVVQEDKVIIRFIIALNPYPFLKTCPEKLNEHTLRQCRKTIIENMIS